MHPGHRIGTVYLYRSVVDFRKSIGSKRSTNPILT